VLSEQFLSRAVLTEAIFVSLLIFSWGYMLKLPIYIYYSFTLTIHFKLFDNVRGIERVPAPICRARSVTPLEDDDQENMSDTRPSKASRVLDYTPETFTAQTISSVSDALASSPQMMRLVIWGFHRLTSRRASTFRSEPKGPAESGK